MILLIEFAIRVGVFALLVMSARDRWSTGLLLGTILMLITGVQSAQAVVDGQHVVLHALWLGYIGLMFAMTAIIARRRRT